MWFSAILALLPLTLVSAVNTIYWPVSSPSKDFAWYINGTNLLAWETGGGTGIDSFDIQLHNGNRSIMIGFIPIALRVPMQRLPKGYKNFGGEMEVDLDADIPTGDGFRLMFMNTYHGQVYSTSDPFSIYPARPDNYTQADLPTATVTATLDSPPNPTHEWAITLNGINPDATQTAQQIVGNVGAGH